MFEAAAFVLMCHSALRKLICSPCLTEPGPPLPLCRSPVWSSNWTDLAWDHPRSGLLQAWPSRLPFFPILLPTIVPTCSRSLPTVSWVPTSTFNQTVLDRPQFCPGEIYGLCFLAFVHLFLGATSPNSPFFPPKVNIGFLWLTDWVFSQFLHLHPLKQGLRRKMITPWPDRLFKSLSQLI